MRNPTHRKRGILDAGLRNATLAVVAGILLIALAGLESQPAQAQQFSVIHTFIPTDGWYPDAGLTIDQAGNLYGTTNLGGNMGGNCGSGCGTVFKMSKRGSGWIFDELYKFNADDGGFNPEARVVFGPNGTLYGTAVSGGSGAAGVVFNLQPPATVCKSVSCPWTETVIFPFQASGVLDPGGDLTFDAAGNIYGTTFYGGNYGDCEEEGCGTIYQLTQSNGVWSQNIVHVFTGETDGQHPAGGVILDRAGNLYGSVEGDPNLGDSGLVFRFIPSGGTWTETILYRFQGYAQGEFPVAGLFFDPSGSLVGATLQGGFYGGGTVYQLSPTGSSWIFDTLHNFDIAGADYPFGPLGKLVMDSAGNLYGATGTDGAYGYGAVFQLRPSDHGWIYRSLYDFTGGTDGSFPRNVVMDASGNLYGITTYGGNDACQAGCGVVFEITP